jgi:hypothetical protein
VGLPELIADGIGWAHHYYWLLSDWVGPLLLIPNILAGPTRINIQRDWLGPPIHWDWLGPLFSIPIWLGGSATISIQKGLGRLQVLLVSFRLAQPATIGWSGSARINIQGYRDKSIAVVDTLRHINMNCWHVNKCGHISVTGQYTWIHMNTSNGNVNEH